MTWRGQTYEKKEPAVNENTDQAEVRGLPDQVLPQISPSKLVASPVRNIDQDQVLRDSALLKSKNKKRIKEKRRRYEAERFAAAKTN